MPLSHFNSKFPIPFFNKLFSCVSVQDFLKLIYKKNSQLCKTKSLILLCHSGHFGPLQYIYNSNGVHKKKYKDFLPQALPEEIRSNSKEDRLYLANLLGRPTQNILSLPVFTNQYSFNKASVLFIEFISKKPEEIAKVYSSLLSFISKCLGQVLLKEHLETGIQLWTATFNKLKEPLAVLDEKNQIINANNHFYTLLKEKNLCLDLKQETIQLEDQVFEKKTYPAVIDEKTYTICYYQDMSESLALRNKMIHNTKMSALGELGESIAHHLNNPLTGIKSMAELLTASQKLDKSTRQDIQQVTESVAHCQDIISNFLDFSREKNQVSVCDLNQIAKRTLPFLKSLTAFSGFQIDFCSEPVWIKASPCLIQQVIFNLIKNACQAVAGLDSNEKEVKASISINDSHAVLKVEDSGPGILKENHKQIFKPFFTTKHKTQGTGLGLNVSKSIVERFKGSLLIENSFLGGACFKMTLPLSAF